MKNVYISLILFICMIFSIIFSINYLDKIYTNIGKLTIDLEQSIDKENWNSADKLVKEISNEIETNSSKISIFVNHMEIDNINNEFSKLTQYIKYHNKEEAMASLYAVRFFFEHTLKLEKINIENIF
ncbi:DUF4363 family protein [Clostridium lundense]|uniref:DUF4363 family protein n=1 Tax=Clostridium lundense TaxID=319475 RepID=UPI000484F18D|nr:DUF4363 family protein [Clostridium lundense]